MMTKECPVCKKQAVFWMLRMVRDGDYYLSYDQCGECKVIMWEEKTHRALVGPITF